MNPVGLLQPESPATKKINQKLSDAAVAFSKPDNHLSSLMKQPQRFQSCSLQIKGFSFDYSRQRLDQHATELLYQAAAITNVLKKYIGMTQGDIVNATECRPALHTATRGSGPESIIYKGMNVRKEIERVNADIQSFTNAIHRGDIKSFSGKPFEQVVVVGIGGSYLGCEFVYRALGDTDKKMDLLFLPNVDIDNFSHVISQIQVETTLWIIISKSYTTTETMANLNQVRTLLSEHKIPPQDHIVTVTAKGSPGDEPENPGLASFHMYDFIGGRYSVSSAVGGLPLSLAFGFDTFQRFLDGCQIMDNHAVTSEPEKNIPLTAALISIWNTLYLGYQTQAIIPYASRLSKLAPHVQQLYMESIGKSVSSKGSPLTQAAGAIIFGEPGTNAQHSFFQLAHQGPAFPIDFIGIITPGYSGTQAQSKGVTNHQELWANLLAQARALAMGRQSDDAAKNFDGNRPSSIIALNNLKPESVGMLLAFYEAKTVMEGFILGVNPFDQFGVELGKIMANDVRKEMAEKNQNPEYTFTKLETDDRYYLNLLFNKGE